MRERGLKYHRAYATADGASVAPHAGAWIEITTRAKCTVSRKSLPMRERGLKYVLEGLLGLIGGGRSPCGSVD